MRHCCALQLQEARAVRGLLLRFSEPAQRRCRGKDDDDS
jgi:hypothetical protein